MPDKPLVRQPPTRMLLGVIIDSVYPPRGGKENCIKGQLAKRILELQLQPGDVADCNKAYDMPMAAAGEKKGEKRHKKFHGCWLSILLEPGVGPLSYAPGGVPAIT